MENEQIKPRNTIAFPAHPDTSNEDLAGMTLRDYFAIKEKAVIANTFWNCESFQLSIKEQAGMEGKEISDLLSEMAYYEADAMLKQREL